MEEYIQFDDLREGEGGIIICKKEIYEAAKSAFCVYTPPSVREFIPIDEFKKLQKAFIIGYLEGRDSIINKP